MNDITPEIYQEKYGDMMLNGLGSSGSYIPLKTNKRSGINIALRPYMVRASDEVVLLGGKFRVGFTIALNGEFEKTKIEAINDEARIAQLKEFCKGFSWMKEDARRFSTLVFVGFAASEYDGTAALERIEGEGMAVEFIQKLEATYAQYNDSKFTSVRKISAALNDAWMLKSAAVFSELPEVVQLPEAVVGKTSGLLNQAQDKCEDNVISFTAKVKKASE